MIFHLDSVMLLIDFRGYVLLSEHKTQVYATRTDLLFDLTQAPQPYMIHLVFNNIIASRMTPYEAPGWKRFLWKRHHKHLADQRLLWISSHNQHSFSISGIFEEQQEAEFQTLLAHLSQTHHRIKSLTPFFLYVYAWVHHRYPDQNTSIVLPSLSRFYVLECTKDGHMSTHLPNPHDPLVSWKYGAPDVILNTTGTSLLEREIFICMDSVQVLKNTSLPHVTYVGNMVSAQQQLSLCRYAQVFEMLLLFTLVVLILVIAQCTIPFWKQI